MRIRSVYEEDMLQVALEKERKQIFRISNSIGAPAVVPSHVDKATLSCCNSGNMPPPLRLKARKHDNKEGSQQSGT